MDRLHTSNLSNSSQTPPLPDDFDDDSSHKTDNSDPPPPLSFSSIDANRTVINRSTDQLSNGNQLRQQFKAQKITNKSLDSASMIFSMELQNKLKLDIPELPPSPPSTPPPLPSDESSTDEDSFTKGDAKWQSFLISQSFSFENANLAARLFNLHHIPCEIEPKEENNWILNLSFSELQEIGFFGEILYHIKNLFEKLKKQKLIASSPRPMRPSTPREQLTTQKLQRLREHVEHLQKEAEILSTTGARFRSYVISLLALLNYAKQQMIESTSRQEWSEMSKRIKDIEEFVSTYNSNIWTNLQIQQGTFSNSKKQILQSFAAEGPDSIEHRIRYLTLTDHDTLNERSEKLINSKPPTPREKKSKSPSPQISPAESLKTTPNESLKSSPNDSKKSSPNESKKTTPNESLKSSPNDSKKTSPRESPKKTSPRESPKKTSPRESSKKTSSRESSKKTSPRESSKKKSPRESSKKSSRESPKKQSSPNESQKTTPSESPLDSKKSSPTASPTKSHSPQTEKLKKGGIASLKNLFSRSSDKDSPETSQKKMKPSKTRSADDFNQTLKEQEEKNQTSKENPSGVQQTEKKVSRAEKFFLSLSSKSISNSPRSNQKTSSQEKLDSSTINSLKESPRLSKNSPSILTKERSSVNLPTRYHSTSRIPIIQNTSKEKLSIPNLPRDIIGSAPSSNERIPTPRYLVERIPSTSSSKERAQSIGSPTEKFTSGSSSKLLPSFSKERRPSREKLQSQKNLNTNPFEISKSSQKPNSSSSLQDIPELLPEEKKAKAVELFNQKPKNAVGYLLTHKLIGQSAQSIALWLHQNPFLSKEKIGECLGESESFFISILESFLENFDFVGMDFDLALRHLLQSFKLPGESQKIERILERFAIVYISQNPGSTFANQDAAWSLAFATIMLNTDAHNPSIKNKMGKAQFIKNLKGMNAGKDFPPEMLTDLYDRIVTDEIKLKEESKSSIYSDAIKKGWIQLCITKSYVAPKEWNRYWCVLMPQVIYYFKEISGRPLGSISPKHSHISRISDLSQKRFVFHLSPSPNSNQTENSITYLSSTEQPNHYYFSVGSEKSLNSWLLALYHIRKRQDVIEELLRTEKLFSRHFHFMLINFIRPFEEKRIFKSEFLYNLCSKAELIFGISEEFQYALTPLISKKDIQDQIIFPVFKQIFEKYKIVLTEYCGYQSEALSLFPHLLKHPSLQLLLKKSNQGISWHLSDISTLITSRICNYYPSIINELIQGLPDFHPDNYGLIQILGILKEMKNEIEKRNLDFQVKTNTKNILNKFDWSHFKDSTWAKPNEKRKFLYKKHGKKISSQFLWDLRHLILFNDQLVIAHKRKSKYKITRVISLKDLRIKDIQRNHYGQNYCLSFSTLPTKLENNNNSNLSSKLIKKNEKGVIFAFSTEQEKTKFISIVYDCMIDFPTIAKLENLQDISNWEDKMLNISKIEDL